MSELITLSLPCPSCGCDTVVGHCKKDGVPIKVEICACLDGSGYFDMYVAYNYNDSEKKTEDYLKYKSKEDIEAFLNRCYEASEIKHHCGSIVVISPDPGCAM